MSIYDFEPGVNYISDIVTYQSKDGFFVNCSVTNNYKYGEFVDKPVIYKGTSYEKGGMVSDFLLNPYAFEPSRPRFVAVSPCSVLVRTEPVSKSDAAAFEKFLTEEFNRGSLVISQDFDVLDHAYSKLGRRTEVGFPVETVSAMKKSLHNIGSGVLECCKKFRDRQLKRDGEECVGFSYAVYLDNDDRKRGFKLDKYPYSVESVDKTSNGDYLVTCNFNRHYDDVNGQVPINVEKNGEIYYEVLTAEIMVPGSVPIRKFMDSFKDNLDKRYESGRFENAFKRLDSCSELLHCVSLDGMEEERLAYGEELLKKEISSAKFDVLKQFDMAKNKGKEFYYNRRVGGLDCVNEGTDFLFAYDYTYLKESDKVYYAEVTRNVDNFVTEKSVYYHSNYRDAFTSLSESFDDQIMLYGKELGDEKRRELMGRFDKFSCNSKVPGTGEALDAFSFSCYSDRNPVRGMYYVDAKIGCCLKKDLHLGQDKEDTPQVNMPDVKKKKSLEAERK